MRKATKFSDFHSLANCTIFVYITDCTITIYDDILTYSTYRFPQSRIVTIYNVV